MPRRIKIFNQLIMISYSECKVDFNIPVGCDQVKARLLQQVISSAVTLLLGHVLTFVRSSGPSVSDIVKVIK